MKSTVNTKILSKYLALLSTFILCNSAIAAESPLVIPFQGQITNQSNELVATGQYSIIFNLYDVAVGGQPLWTERHSKVGVTKGMVNVFLGSITSMAAVDFSQTRYLGITVDVDDKPTTADPEMVPRQMIIPAFHAKNSEKLAGYNWSAVMTGSDPSTAFIQSARIDANTINTNQMSNSAVTDVKLATNAVTTGKLTAGAVTNEKLAANSVATANVQDGAITAAKLSTDVTTPAGTVVAYIGDTAPTGWYLCDGSDKPRGGVNTNLETVVGTRFGMAANPGANFKLPDFRGYFLRGVDGAAGRDPNSGPSANNGADGKRFPMSAGGATGNAIGSVQSDTFQQHRHMTVVPADQNMGSALTSSEWAIAYRAAFRVYTDRDDYMLGGHNGEPSVGKTSTVGGSETRPKNAYVNYIIKY